MNSLLKPTIAVFGSTGRQGGSVVRYLREQGGFRVRAITRNPEQAKDIADEVVYGDLTKPETLDAALKDTYGVFLVTNYWDVVSTDDWAQTPSAEWSDPVDEFAQGKAAVEAAKRAGVKHFIWSTLPNTKVISDGKYDLPFWTGKSKLDDVVADAGFDYHSFVEAPFYFQNFLKEMAPAELEDGTKVWQLPMQSELKVIHMGDIEQMGAIVLGALLKPEEAGQGQYMSLAGGLYSWSDVVDVFNEQGHQAMFEQIPNETFDAMVPGAKNLRDSLNYMEEHTYYGPDAEKKVALAQSVATEQLTSLESWVETNPVFA